MKKEINDMGVSVTTMKNTYGSNVVSKDTLNKYQLAVLETLKGNLMMSFGPFGSNTGIKKINALNKYTKDGHTILSNIQFTGIVEESIRADIESITRHIVETVGDGTTSAVVLSYYIFKYILEMIEKEEKSIPPVVITETLENMVYLIKEEIKRTGYTCTEKDIYDIALISANGDKEIAKIIHDIYKECGMGVFIDVAMSTNQDTAIKYYDGMTLNTGYADTAFITNASSNTSVVDNPEIYFFEDPIDTKEMGVFLDAILSGNIMRPYGTANYSELVPTVIVAPKISRDMSSLLDTLITMQSKATAESRLPVLIISDTHQVTELMDICKMCGAKPIRKYIDKDMYTHDVEQGLAPTPDTVARWAGNAESVVASSTTTKFINPMCIVDDDKTEYNNLLSFITSSLEEAEKNGDDAHTIGTLKRRLNSLKGNLVEIHIGGMSASDRDAKRDLLEDAVKNCRSAAANGVGWGCNFSGKNAVDSIIKNFVDDDGNNLITKFEMNILSIIYSSYISLIKDLYKMSGIAEEYATYNMPINIRTNTHDSKVKSSIESDIIILESVCKIVGMMVTCNQFLTPNPQLNPYEDLKEVN